MSWSLGQQQALAIVPKVTGLLSAALSGVIASVIFRDPKKREKVYHRLILGMSLADISSSLWLSLSTWPIPEETGILWAVGTLTSCNFQGFFTQFGISSPLYNMSLSVYYLLAVRFGWREERLKSVEIWFHIVPVSWALGTAIAGLPLEIFNSANLWCWIADDAIGNRNDSTNIYRWVFFYGPLWAAIIVVTICLCVVFAYVRSVTLRSERHSRIRLSTPTPTIPFQVPKSSDMGSGDDIAVSQESHKATMSDTLPRSSVDNDRATTAHFEGIENPVSEESTPGSVNGAVNENLSASKRITAAFTSLRRPRNSFVTTLQFAKRRREVAHQCLRYALAFYWTWIPISLVRILQTANAKPIYALFFLAAMNTPFQGLPNFLVYLYPRFQTMRKANPNSNFVRLVRLSLAPEAQLSTSGGIDEITT